MNSTTQNPPSQFEINRQILVATEEGDISSIQRLMPQATNLFNAQDSIDQTPLRKAASAGQTQALLALLPAYRETGLHDIILAFEDALRQGHANCARELVAAIPPKTFAVEGGTHVGAGGFFVRAIEAPQSEEACLQTVFELVGNDLQQHFANGALGYAANRQKPKLVRMLLPFADANFQNSIGQTALMLSCVPSMRPGGAGPDGRVTALLLPLSNPGLLATSGDTALGLAIQHKAWPCMDVLGSDQLRREPQNAVLRDLLRENQARLPKCRAQLEAEELLAVVDRASDKASNRVLDRASLDAVQPQSTLATVPAPTADSSSVRPAPPAKRL